MTYNYAYVFLGVVWTEELLRLTAENITREELNDLGYDDDMLDELFNAEPRKRFAAIDNDDLCNYLVEECYFDWPDGQDMEHMYFGVEILSYDLDEPLRLSDTLAEPNNEQRTRYDERVSTLPGWLREYIKKNTSVWVRWD